MKVLSESDVERLIPLVRAVALMEVGFRDFDPAAWEIPLRIAADLATARKSMLSMPVFSREHGRIYNKLVLCDTGPKRSGSSRATALATVWDAASGEPLLAAEWTYATALRTAATAAAASKLMARPNSRSIALIGAGYLGRLLLRCLEAVLPLERAWVYDRGPEQARRFQDWANAHLRLPVEVATSAQRAVAVADLVVAATDSSLPVFDGRDLKPGTHVISIGSYRPDMREVDETTLRKSRIVVDALDHTPQESGDLIRGIKNDGVQILGDLTWLLRNPSAARQSGSDITLFKSAGFAFQDALLLESLLDA